MVAAWNSWRSATLERSKWLGATRNGLSVLRRLSARRAESGLRGAIDRWFLAVHSPTVQLVGGSRAIQLLFAVDMRIMQRSLVRWRALAGSEVHYGHSQQPSSPLALSPVRPGSPISPLSDTSVGSPLVQRSLEVHHFRRLLWSHVASQTSAAEAWAQGRASVLGASQRSVTSLLCRRLRNKTLLKAWSKWCDLVNRLMQAALRHASQSVALGVMSRALVSMNHAGLLSGWNKWQGFASAANRVTAEATAALEKQGVGLRLISRWLERKRVNTIGGALVK